LFQLRVATSVYSFIAIARFNFRKSRVPKSRWLAERTTIH
jgi:hypothetical protein